MLNEGTIAFRKYPSIEGVHIEEFLGKIKEICGNEMYCVTEKIHGANTQIDYDLTTGEFTYGKRTDVITEDEQCYNFQKIAEKLKDNIIKMSMDLLFSTELNIEVVRVYGELFGGSYPHPDVEKDKKATRVQKGVYYSPHNEWRAFDIAYSVKGEDRNRFLPAELFFDFASRYGIPTVPLLCIADSLDMALRCPNDNKSVVFQYYALPEIPDNIMEGVVIKPWKHDLWIGQHRVILKNKNDKFKERSKDKRVNIQEEVPEIVKQAMEEIVEFITENRINNVISHLGQVTVKDIGKVIGLTSVDVLSEYRRVYKTLNLMEKKEEKMVTKFMQGQVAKLVKEVMTGRKDG